MIRFTCMIIILAGFNECSSPPPSQNNVIAKLYETESFKAYWYSGTAEVNSYKLDQSRYGENRAGKAMLIFVTEDFSRKKQVKLDDPSTIGEDKISVLKMNFTKNFVTGIYPYSMMLSVFSPISRNLQPHSLKVTMSSQEWCGHVFSQMSLDGNKFKIIGHSYFEQEGESKATLAATWLEDELWSVIRLEPENLPVGNIEIIPGLFFTRLKHTELKLLRAIIDKNENGQEVLYSINLPEQDRRLVIRYQKEFPHKILGWVESFTERGQNQQTIAVLDKTIRIDYWKKNMNEFRYFRDSLGLSPTNF